MSARSVEFIFELIDRFSPVAARLAASAKQATGTLMNMGHAANSAERSVNAMAAGQERVARSFQNSARAVRDAERANQLYYQSANRIEKMQLGMLERNQARQGLVQAGLLPPAGGRHAPARNGAMDMMGAFMGFQIAAQIQTGFGHWLNHADAQFMGRKRMGLVGFKGDMMKEAEEAAVAMTKKYSNLSKGEVYEMLHEGVAIHGNAHESILNVEQQAKMMSFMSAWEGGKHAGHGKQAFREVQAWIKSMEMKGVLNESDPAKRQQMIDDYVQAGLAMKVAYPENQLRLSDMLLMQKRAGTAWYNLSDEFRFGYAPAMAQERGGNIVGTALMSAFASIRGGKKLSKAEMGAMKEYGLFDAASGRWTEGFQNQWSSNPFVAAQDIASRVAKRHGLDPHNEQQRDRLSNELTKAFSWLFPNRTASTQFLDLVFNNENFKKHAEYMALVRKEMKEIEKAAKEGKVFAATTKGGAEAGVSKQWSNFMAAIGLPMEPIYIDRMNSFAKMLNRLSESVGGFFNNNPMIGKAAGHTAMLGLTGLTAFAGLGALGLLFGGIKAGMSMLPGAKLLSGAAKLGVGAAAGGAALPLALASMALPALLRGGPPAVAAVATGGGAAAAASARMISGMSAFGRSSTTLAASFMPFMRAIRMFTVAGAATYLGAAAWENRGRIRQFGSDARDVGRNAYYMRLFSGDTLEAVNKMLGRVNLPPLNIDTIQNALNSAGNLIMQAAQKLWNMDFAKFLRFQAGLMNFSEFYGDDPRKSPWLAGASEDMIKKVEERVRKEQSERQRQDIEGKYGDLFLGTPWNDRFSEAIQRYNNPLFKGDRQTIDEWQGFARMPNPDLGTYGQGFAAPARKMLDADVTAGPRADAEREIKVQTHVQVNQSVPLTGSVAVTINGTVNGPVNGNGTAQLTGAAQAKADAPRGESSPLNMGAGN